MRESRRGHEDDVILARGNQYSTGPASASHSFSTKLQLGKKGGKKVNSYVKTKDIAKVLNGTKINVQKGSASTITELLEAAKQPAKQGTNRDVLPLSRA